jgi:hypothetical protein
MGHYNGTWGRSGVLKGAHAPDGATAGTAVVGASVGERVTAQTPARRWMARQKADVSTRRVPVLSSKKSKKSLVAP